MTTTYGPSPSVNARAGKLVDELAASAVALRCGVSTGEAGERRIDLGSLVTGGLEAGRRPRRNLHGRSWHRDLDVQLRYSSAGRLGVMVHSANPRHRSASRSQYAGWTITDAESGFFAPWLGARGALSRVEELFKELGYTDHHNKAALVIEGDKAPPAAVAAQRRRGLRRADRRI